MIACDVLRFADGQAETESSPPKSAGRPQSADGCQPLAETYGDRLVELREQVAVAVQRHGDRRVTQPMRVWIAFGCAPSAIARATLVWRKSWNRQVSPTESRAGLK